MNKQELQLDILDTLDQAELYIGNTKENLIELLTRLSHYPELLENVELDMPTRYKIIWCLQAVELMLQNEIDKNILRNL